MTKDHREEFIGRIKTRLGFASGLASRGMDVQDIQKLLGHSNLNTTMVYVHTDQTAVAMSYQKYAI